MSQSIASASNITTQGQQWIRQGKLLVAAPALSNNVSTQPGLDLSDLRFTFNIRQQDVGTPNTGIFRVYNLNDETSKVIRTEFTRVSLQCGYLGTQAGIIFDGTIVQTKFGKENNTDKFLEIRATEGDLPYNFAVVNTTIGPNASVQQRLSAINKAVTPYNSSVDMDSGTSMTGGILPRGKVLFGMALAHLDDLTQTVGWTWAIVNGKITLIPLTGYLPGEAVVLNSRTGLIGQPESTQEGVQAVCLINPKIRVGTRVQINNKDINQTINKDGNIVASYDNPFAGAYASVTADGIYRVVVQEYEGDSRGNPWYARLTCLAVDPSAPPAQSVPVYP